MYSGIEYRVSGIGYRILDIRSASTSHVHDIEPRRTNQELHCVRISTFYEDDDEEKKLNTRKTQLFEVVEKIVRSKTSRMYLCQYTLVEQRMVK